MALTQVRAKLGDTWTVLTYNEATGRYEGTLTPPGTSIHQPGGYYSLTVEATNESGATDSLTGAQYAGLRLVVRETAAPTLTLVSPPSGWLTTNSPSFVFTAQDEAGGSGIDPDSAQASIDGASVPCTVTESGGVYTITFAGQALSEGPHTVTAAISDYDGNETTASAAYTVDTVPPVLSVVAPDLHRVVDDSEVEISGYASDATSGVASVMVGGVSVELDQFGGFSRTVPLDVGENNISIVVTDQAGHSTTKTVWMLRLITDRTQEDVDKLQSLYDKVKDSGWSSLSESELAYWDGIVKGAYNAEDMNRVGKAVEYIAQVLEDAGYTPDVDPKTDWAEQDTPTVSQTETYLDNVAEIKSMVPVTTPDVPPDMDKFEFSEANNIEKILVITDRVFPLLERSYVFSGEAFSGEF